MHKANGTFVGDLYHADLHPCQARDVFVDAAIEQVEISAEAYTDLQNLTRYGHGSIGRPAQRQVSAASVDAPQPRNLPAAAPQNDKTVLTVVTGRGADFAPRERTKTDIVHSTKRGRNV